MGKAVLVISYDQPEDTSDAIHKLSETADKVRELFQEQKDVKVYIGIRETADEVVELFRSGR